MWIRQVAMAAVELVQADNQLKAFLGVSDSYTDEGVSEFGLTNYVYASGRSFIEVVSPTQPDTAAGRTLARQGGDCGYMVLFQVRDLAQVRARVEAAGYRKIWQIDRPEVTAFHVHPKDVGGPIVSFDEMRPEDEWLWAGPGWRERRALQTGDLTSCTIEVIEPQTTAKIWAELLGTTVLSDADGPTLEMEDGCKVLFRKAPNLPARGLVAFSLTKLQAGTDGAARQSSSDSATICGVDVSMN